MNRIASGAVEAPIDAEVLQEILHRYLSLHRWDDGQRVYDLARRLFPDVLAIKAEVMDEARRILVADNTLSVRDAVHAAVIAVYKLDDICSFDGDFDRIAGCTRVGL